MVVFGTLKVGEEAGNILFTGDLDQCREYAGKLNHSDYYELSICQDDGIITEKIVIPNTGKKMDRTITIRIKTEQLPESVRGVSVERRPEDYIMLLNGREDDPETVAAFLHEMLHIYHGDHGRAGETDGIEEERHEELQNIIAVINKRG